MNAPRIAVASIIQESNTFSPAPTALDDFRAQGLWLAEQAAEESRGSNTEIAGAIEAIEEAGAVAVPIMRAWAMSAGPLTAEAMSGLEQMLESGLRSAAPIDAVVLCLHGALVAENCPSVDARLASLTREIIGADTCLVVTHDLHANVTPTIIDSADAVVGYHTYPHVDQGDTGRRAAALALRAVVHGAKLATVLDKRAMLIPAETQAIADEPMSSLRRLADDLTVGGVVDISLFPVQPWLDVPWLGFGVTVAHIDAAQAAATAAQTVADAAWAAREAFQVALTPLDAAVAALSPAGAAGPRILVHSADSPTAGATGDDASVIAALLERGPDLRCLVTVVDQRAVAACFDAGVEGRVRTTVGASLDPRWSRPVLLEGTVVKLGETPVILAGESMTGQAIALGRWATVDAGRGMSLLLTERPAPTFDPQGYRHAGLEPRDADVVVVRSATMYRAGYRGLYSDSVVLDLPGASTPAFKYLEFVNTPRPLYPLDAVTDGGRMYTDG